MDRIALPDGPELSRIAYGMWRVTADDTSPAHVQAKIEACLEQGITTIDQADIYGNYEAEAVLGDCLRAAPHLRDQIEIVTKCSIVLADGPYSTRGVKHYDTSRAHILRSVENSLKAMNTDRIDLLLIHRPDPLMDACETASVLDELVSEGPVRAVGVSNFKPHDWDLLTRSMQGRLSTNQIEVSLAAPEAFSDGTLAHLQALGVPPMAWSPLGGGRIGAGTNPLLDTVLARVAADFGVTPVAVAIAWLLHHPARIIPVMGSNTLDRIRAFSDALKVTLDRETWFELLTAATGREVA